MNAVYVMIGGALGALMRYGVSRWCAGITLMSVPIGTFVANMAGCFMLGVLTGVGVQYAGFPKSLMLMLTTGMCGAFTTFSTFSGETIRMMESGQIVHAVLYLAASIIIGFLLYWLGKSLV